MTKHQRTLLAGATFAVLVSVAAVRFLTFDPIAWAAGVNEEVSPLPMVMRQDPQRPKEVADAELAAWRARAVPRWKAMQARFHSGTGACTRYGRTEPAPALVSEAADAIVQEGLAPEINALVADVARWRTEADDRRHAIDGATEMLIYFGESAGLWQRLGLWMHRDAALAALRKHAPLPVSERHVRPESIARARGIGERYGSVLVPAALRVHGRLRGVDLHASQIAFVSPGMGERELEVRLGAPAERTSDTWTWKVPAVEVLLDEQHEAIAVSRTIQGSGDALVAGDAELATRDEPTLLKTLGQPAWTHDDGERRELVWNAGPLRRRALFESGSLARVELWNKDRLAPPN